MGIFHESDEIGVIHECQSKHGHDLGKRNVPLDHSGQYRAEEIGDEYHPGLDLDGIHTLTVEKVQGKVLFYCRVKLLPDSNNTLSRTRSRATI